MIYINNKTVDKDTIKLFEDYDSLYIVTDFDKTITDGNSSSSWSLLSKSNLSNTNYKDERNLLFDKYHPYEIDPIVSLEDKCRLLSEWWNKHIELLYKYEVTSEMIDSIATDSNFMNFRSGAKDFLSILSNHNVPVVIISAGIGNFIESFLKANNCYTSNIHLISNIMDFKAGYNNRNTTVIHSFNKNEVSIPPEILSEIKNRNNLIILGDNISDLNMISIEKRDRALKIGFLEEDEEVLLKEFLEKFDIVCTGNSSFNDIFEYLSGLN